MIEKASSELPREHRHGLIREPKGFSGNEHKHLHPPFPRMCYFTGTGNKTQVKRDTRPALRNVPVKGDGTTPNTVVGRRPQSPPAHGRSREHIRHENHWGTACSEGCEGGGGGGGGGGGVINMGLVLVYVTLRSLLKRLKRGNVTGELAPHYHAAATWSLHEGR